MNRTNCSPKTIGTFITTFLMLMMLATPALAQEQQTEVIEGQDHKLKYNEALEAAKAKDYQKAYVAFEEAVTLAQAANATDISERALSVLAKLDDMNGKTAYKAENFELAIAEFEKGIEHDPSNPNNYYGKALALKKLERTDEAMALFAEVMEMDDREARQAAQDAIRDHYIYLASSTLSGAGSEPTRSAAEQAIGHLRAMTEYIEPDADYHYYMAEAQKATGDFQASIESANQALELHRGSRADKAKIYFVLGESHMLAGSNGPARDAFTEALYGEYKPLAEHYLEELKTVN